MSRDVLNQPTEKIDVLLPAGGRLEGEFAAHTGQAIKALIAFHGETMLHRTIRVLRETGLVGRIVVIGPDAALDEAKRAGADATLWEGDSGTENIFRGLDWLQSQPDKTPRRVLIVATDLPFLTTDAVKNFLAACPKSAAIAVPVITKSDMETCFPGLQNDWVPLREGPVTLGCVFLVNAETLQANRASLDKAFAARKSQIAMARLLGFGFILKFLRKKLSVADIEAQCRRMLHCEGTAVLNAPPEIAFDIDLPVEYEYACTHAAKAAKDEKGNYGNAR